MRRCYHQLQPNLEWPFLVHVRRSRQYHIVIIERDEYLHLYIYTPSRQKEREDENEIYYHFINTLNSKCTSSINHIIFLYIPRNDPSVRTQVRSVWCKALTYSNSFTSAAAPTGRSKWMDMCCYGLSRGSLFRSMIKSKKANVVRSRSTLRLLDCGLWSRGCCGFVRATRDVARSF